MNYWLINPKSEGSNTNLSDIPCDYVYMGWDEQYCPKFYQEVKQGDVIVITEGSHKNSKVHFVGLADRLEDKCWHLTFVTTQTNTEIEEIIHQKPNDFGGGGSSNPWGPTKSIIKLEDRPSEKRIKSILGTFFKEAKMKATIQEYINLLRSTHNLILTGAPGTGKTYLARQIAEAMGAEFDFVQFHPSYDYTDFVEGLRPIQDDNGNVGFERKDGVFKAFCKKAVSFPKNDTIDNFNETWDKLVDTLNENNYIDVPFLSNKSKSFRVELNEYGTGLANRTYPNDTYEQGGWISGQSKFFSKDQLYNIYRGMSGVPSGGHDNYRRAIVEEMKKSLGLKPYKEGSSETKSDKDFVFIIDEINRGEISKIFGELFFSIDPGYRGKDGMVETQYQNMIEDGDTFKKGFFVPENVYIIGTMNDIDRSVESMDFAMRRRFAWKEVTAEDSMQMLDGLTNADEMKARMRKINNEILHTPGLGKVYQIGAAYFKKYELYNDFDLLWEYHLEGLLFEYLRGNTDIDKTMKKLAEAYGYTKSNKYEPTANN